MCLFISDRARMFQHASSQVCLFTFSYGGVTVYRCSEAACYMYPSGYMLAGSHHLNRVSYLMKSMLNMRARSEFR
uniref:Secreted protein n=1 Tax=Strongyloides venezuelensis TaxID=75913 RepID=A0A0K0G586_STRVS